MPSYPLQTPFGWRRWAGLGRALLDRPAAGRAAAVRALLVEAEKLGCGRDLEREHVRWQLAAGIPEHAFEVIAQHVGRLGVGTERHPEDAAREDAGLLARAAQELHSGSTMGRTTGLRSN